MTYRLEVESRTPYWHDRTTITSDDFSDFEPEHVDRGGVMFERYASDDGGYIEIRLDLIVLRRVVKDEEDQPTYRQVGGSFDSLTASPAKDSTN